MSSSSNKNKKAVSFSLKTSPQAKGKPVSKPQAPVAAKNQKQPVKNAFQPKAAVKPSVQAGAVKNTSFQSKPQPQSQPKPKQAAAPVVNKIQPRPAQAAVAKSNKGSNTKNIQPIKSQPQPKHQPAKPAQHPQIKSAQQKPQHQQLKTQPKISVEPKPHVQPKNQAGQKVSQHNHSQSKQQPQPKQQPQSKQQFQPKQPVSAQPKSQPQQKNSQNAQSFTKQQPSKVNPAVELRKAAMTSDKDKVKVQAPVKHQPVHDATPLHHSQPAGVSHAADFSAETLALLFKNAKKVSENAYAPYSRFKVGAVLILEDAAGDAGQISAYTGCNVENASYGLTCCAERIAIFKAVSDGNKKFKAMIIYASAKKPVSPCGACRQVIAEFAAPDMKVYSIGQFKDEDVSKTPYAVYTVAELLPHGFKASDFIEKK